VSISAKWNGKAVEVAMAKSEVLCSHLPGGTKENKTSGDVSWLRFEPDTSIIKVRSTTK
jgi:hypothetical protein